MTVDSTLSRPGSKWFENGCSSYHLAKSFFLRHRRHNHAQVISRTITIMGILTRRNHKVEMPRDRRLRPDRFIVCSFPSVTFSRSRKGKLSFLSAVVMATSSISFTAAMSVSGVVREDMTDMAQCFVVLPSHKT
jgi:hypothetical protein